MFSIKKKGEAAPGQLYTHKKRSSSLVRIVTLAALVDLCEPAREAGED